MVQACQVWKADEPREESGISTGKERRAVSELGSRGEVRGQAEVDELDGRCLHWALLLQNEVLGLQILKWAKSPLGPPVRLRIWVITSLFFCSLFW